MNNKLIIAGAALAGVIGLAAVVRQSSQPTGLPAAGVQAIAPTTQFQAEPVADKPSMAPPPARTAVRSTTPQRVVTQSTPRTITTKRSKKTSAAIIGGSAGAGAAIGALAGGGKGAAIGAIAGGVGGLIYDRSTHKKTRVIE